MHYFTGSFSVVSRSARLTRQLLRRFAMVAFVLLLSLVASRGVFANENVDDNPRKPNIVVILLDDMGFSDFGCYGSEIPTPNIDALANNGLRFTRFYNTGRCCPTRASLLTGLYSHQAGVGHMNQTTGHPGYQGHLNDRCVTIGNVASSAGYLTSVSGKWHVGSKKRSMWPLQRGFDRFYGIPEGGGFYFQVKTGRSIVLNNKVLATPEKPLEKGWYSTDAFTENGLKFIDEAQKMDKPFLLYLAHNAPHFPLQADAEDIARFRNKYRKGWEVLSKERYQRQLEMGLIEKGWSKSSQPTEVPEWDSLSDEKKDKLDHQMAAYAATLHRVDLAIKHLVDGLKSRGVFDNTLILLMSDNGGCAEGGLLGKAVGDPTTAASNWFCGKSWAYLQNTPFRLYKHYNHEGGISTPLIAHWPNGIQARGDFCHTPAHVIDIMPTIAELTGGAYPETNESKKIHPMEGKSLVDLFENKPVVERGPIFWEHEGNAAVLKGNWKLVRKRAKGKWELFDMANDRTEQKDLAQSKPKLRKELLELWRSWAKRCNVAVGGVPKRNSQKRNNQKQNQNKNKK